MTNQRQNLYNADFSRPVYMSSTAGANIRPFKFDNSYHAAQLFLAPVLQTDKFFFIRKKYMGFLIIIDNPIRFFFYFQGLIHRKTSVEINRHCFFGHMKSHIIKTESLMHQSGIDMFSRMVLHVIKTTFPVDGPMNFRSYRNFFGSIMDDVILFFPRIRNRYII